MPHLRPYRLTTLALAALTIAAPAASAHHRQRPDPVAHIALGTSSCANANTPATQASRQAMRKAVVCLINQERTARHLPALREQPRLDRSAQAWTSTMVSKNSFSHGTDFAGRIQAAGYDWQFAGENIATGFETPQEAVSAWMLSQGHCRNILDPQYANVGTGVAPQVVSSVASGAGTWTQDFGLTMSQNAPSSNWAPADGCPYI